VPIQERTGIAVPPVLERLVLGLLAKRPSERPPTAQDVATRLAAVEVEPWTEAQAALWWKERA